MSLPECPNVIGILSSDRLRRERTFETLFGHFFISDDCPRPTSDRRVKKLDAALLTKEQLNTLAEDLNRLSLFEAEQIFLIDNIEQANAAAAHALVAIVKDLNNGSFLIILGKPQNKKSVLIDFLKKQQKLIALPDLHESELRRFIAKELQRANILSYPDSLLDLLLNSGKKSLDQIAMMIERLALYLDGNQASEDDFHALFSEIPDPNEYILLDAIQNKDWNTAELHLYNLFKSGKSPFALLSLLYHNYQQYFLVRCLIDQSKPHDQIRESLGIKDWLLRKHLSAVRNQSAAALQRKLQAILAADSMLKNRSLGADAIFGELIQKLAA